MATVKLPDGQTAELRDDAELTNKELKSLRKSARMASAIAMKISQLGFDADDPKTWTVTSQITDEEDDKLDLYQRTCLIMRLKSWTLDRPLPTTPEEVDDLPRPIFVPLTVAAADINFSDDFSVDVDPKARTGNSTSSGKRS